MHLLNSVSNVVILSILINLFNKLITLCAFLQMADRVIQRKRRDYLDPNSSNNMKKLNDDLQSIHNIMRTTINDVLDR